MATYHASQAAQVFWDYSFSWITGFVLPKQRPNDIF
jgi:hypothetical protein